MVTCFESCFDSDFICGAVSAFLSETEKSIVSRGRQGPRRRKEAALFFDISVNYTENIAALWLVSSSPRSIPEWTTGTNRGAVVISSHWLKNVLSMSFLMTVSNYKHIQNYNCRLVLPNKGIKHQIIIWRPNNLPWMNNLIVITQARLPVGITLISNYSSGRLEVQGLRLEPAEGRWTDSLAQLSLDYMV